jgi:hypothetical protein
MALSIVEGPTALAVFDGRTTARAILELWPAVAVPVWRPSSAIAFRTFPLLARIAWAIPMRILRAPVTRRLDRAVRPRLVAAGVAASRLAPLREQTFSEAPPLLVARNLEARPRIGVRPSRPPRRTAVLALLGPRHLRQTLFFFRMPQAAPRPPPQRGIGVACLQLLQRRQQLRLGRGPEGGRRPAEDDRPVAMAWRHQWCSRGSSRLSFSISVVRFSFSSLAA